MKKLVKQCLLPQALVDSTETDRTKNLNKITKKLSIRVRLSVSSFNQEILYSDVFLNIVCYFKKAVLKLTFIM